MQVRLKQMARVLGALACCAILGVVLAYAFIAAIIAAG